MTVRTKIRDPKLNEFSRDEIVINIKEGSLFFKSNLGLHKLEPESTTIVEVSPTPPAQSIPQLNLCQELDSEVNDTVCNLSKRTITLNEEIGDSNSEVAAPSIFVLPESSTYQNNVAGEDSNTVTLGLSPLFGGSDDDDPSHRVLKIENKSGFVEIGPVGFSQIFGNGNSTPGVVFRTDKYSFSFTSQYAQMNGEARLITKGGSNSGYRTSEDNLWLSTTSENIDTTDEFVDQGHIEVKHDEASTTIYGDLNVQSNTADTTDNTGIGNLNVDGNVITDELEVNSIIFTSANGTRFRLFFANQGFPDFEELPD